ncbi:MAG: FkbM family methyltransferase [bacterium]|nr:FkbM family methyltransferase [bacterium]
MSSAADVGSDIFAFEASEEACRAIQEHAELNGLERVRVINAVVGESSGIVVDFFGSHTSGGASTIEGYLGHTNGLNKVTLALDDFAAGRDLRPDLVKIDVEGGERAVIAGARQLLETARPIAVVELHSWETNTVCDNAGAILPLLRQAGYEMIYLRSRQPVTDVAALAGRGRCHVLLVPAGTGMPTSLDDFDTSKL